MVTARKRKEKEAEEAEEAEERKLPPVHVVFETIRLEGEHEIARAPLGLAFSGLAAGLALGLSFVVTAFLRTYLPDAPWRPLIESMGYTIGFVVVIMGRQQLFTENTLTPILPLLRKPTPQTAWRVLRLWVIVLAANVVGCAVIASVFAWTPAIDPRFHDAMHAIAREAISKSFGAMFWGAVFAGWLIALTIWLIPATEGGAPSAIVMLLTYLIALGHFSHVIAGSVDTLYLVFTGGATGPEYLTAFFIPTFLGNVVGGVLVVSLLGFAQVQPDMS